MSDFHSLLISLNTSIRNTIEVIDRGEQGIALVVGENKKLIGTITDGDIRRAILRNMVLDRPVSELLDQKKNSPYPEPVTVAEGTPKSEIIKKMQEEFVRHIPVVNSNGEVVEMLSLDHLIPQQDLPIQAVIMAGGYGKRLLPLTKDVPKPLLPVGEKPILEHIISQLEQTGIREMSVTTHFHAEKLKQYLDNKKLGKVNINFVEEEKPLGTAGALSTLKTSGEPILVINGDIVTKLDFRSFYEFHVENQAELTVAARQYSIEVPYGVLKCDGPVVTEVQEKPVHNFLVNAGIYILESSALSLIPKDESFDMTDLIEGLLREGRKVVSFPVVEYWMDIGRPEDYKQARRDAKSGKLKQ